MGKPDVIRQSLLLIFTTFIFLAGIFWLRSNYSPYDAEGVRFGVVGAGEWIMEGITAGTIAHFLICCMLVFYCSFITSRIISRNMVFSARTYIPVVFFILPALGVFVPSTSVAVLIASAAMVKSTEYFVGSFMRNYSFGHVFRGGFYLGLIPLFYAPGTIYILLILLACIIFKRTWRERLVSLCGYLFPILAYSYAMWIFKDDFTGFFRELTASYGSRNGIDLLYSNNPVGHLRMTALGYSAVLLSISVFVTFRMMPSMRTRVHKILKYLLYILLITTVMLLLPGGGPEGLLLFAIPFSFVLTALFVTFTGIVSVAAYCVLLLLFAALNIFPLLEAFI